METDGKDELRGNYLVAMEAVTAASESMIAALQDANGARAIVREHMAAGGRVSELEYIVDPGVLRAAVSAAIIELERTRHDAQRLLFLLLQAEGQTMTAIARMWGISRQLVSRLVNEPTAGASP